MENYLLFTNFANASRRTERSLQGEYFLKEKGVIELSSILKLRNFGIHEDDGSSTASV